MVSGGVVAKRPLDCQELPGDVPPDIVVAREGWRVLAAGKFARNVIRVGEIQRVVAS